MAEDTVGRALHHITDYRHRYLMNRLSLQVFYLSRHVLSTAPQFTVQYIMVVKKFKRNTVRIQQKEPKKQPIL
jgi:hypothetical protein